HDEFVRALIAHVETHTGCARAEIVARLALAQNSLDEAAIFTIHGFASRALSDTPFAAGLPFAVEVITSDDTIRDDVVGDFWRRHVASAACAPALASYLINRRDSPESFPRIVARRTAKPLAELRFPPGIGDTAPDPAALVARFAEARECWMRDRR